MSEMRIGENTMKVSELLEEKEKDSIRFLLINTT